MPRPVVPILLAAFAAPVFADGPAEPAAPAQPMVAPAPDRPRGAAPQEPPPEAATEAPWLDDRWAAIRQALLSASEWSWR